MKYYSTNRNSPLVDFKEATVRGQAPDKGLYFPETIPVVDPAMIKGIDSYSNEEIAFRVIRPYTGETIPEEKLEKIVKDTINFPIPLVQVNSTTWSLELFHGPTLAFKDVGARFMSRCLGYFLKDENKKVTVLVATSGDTGGAVANGFYDIEGIDVVILYPSGKVSPVQEKQLTALGKNIHALEVNGSFDDCQQMVKAAFMDTDLNQKILLTSANSINVARWLPQQFYYFFAFKQWADKAHPPVISVPSGNFGNICAGLLANQSGLPVEHFIAACNANDVVTKYLDLSTADLDAMGKHNIEPHTAIPTLSNAMDVGDPSNFVRILEIFNHQFPDLKNKLSSFSISDNDTIATIIKVYQESGYLLDPHGAVGYLALEKFSGGSPATKGIFLETAHPVKFPDAVEKCTGIKIPVPASLKTIMSQDKKSTKIDKEYKYLKEYFLGSI